MSAVFWQFLQIILVVAISPLITGWVRLVKSRLNGRQGASATQPYRDIYRLLQKEAVVAHSASWVFRVAPYVTFGAVWLAASIVPAFTTNLFLAQAADLIALVALLGVARFWTALAGMDVGTSFGGLGASREMMIASLAEPAMLMVTFSLSLISGTTAPAQIIAFVLSGGVGIEVSLGLALAALVMVAIAENGRIPIDNPATHLELTMVHEAMVLEYSGRHLAVIELAAQLKLVLYISLIASLFLPFGMAPATAGVVAWIAGAATYLAKLVFAAVLLGVWEVSIAKMRIFRVSEFLGGAFVFAFLAILLAFLTGEVTR